MTTSILETTGTVRPDGTLELDRKVVGAPGRVKVRVEYIEAPAAPTESLIEYVERTRRDLEVAGHKFMTDEEGTAWIEELRN